MKRSDPDAWYLPPTALLLLAVPCVTVGASLLLPVLLRLKAADLSTWYGLGVGTGALGIVLLFFARLPLYRARKWMTVGPGNLDRPHRRLYWLAYVLIAGSVLFLLTVWQGGG